jgi:CO/xanthine dehydrogenase Mo-binding subunit
VGGDDLSDEGVLRDGDVIANGAYFAMGPYHCESVDVVGVAVRTNNPPTGAMRGFGAVQVCFGYEAQMDKLADALGMDPIDLRLKNALDAGDTR